MLNIQDWTNIHPDFSKGNSWGANKQNYQQIWEEKDLSYNEAKEWIRAGLKPEEHSTAYYLKKEGYQPFNSDISELKQIYENWKRNTRFTSPIWLEWKYPVKRNVKMITHEPWEWLSDELKIEDFPNLKEIHLDCQGLDAGQLTNLKIINCPNLVKIYCSGNLLTYLDLSLIRSENLTHVICGSNRLTTIALPSNFEKLKFLDLSNNNFESDLSFLAPYRNLKYLFLGNNWEYAIKNDFYNYFYGSLIYLRNMKDLVVLDLENTFINEGLEYLPIEKLRGINCSVNLIPQASVAEIYNICGEDVKSYDLVEIYQELELGQHSWQRQKEFVGFDKEKLRNFQISQRFLPKREEELTMLLADKESELAKEREKNKEKDEQIRKLEEELLETNQSLAKFKLFSERNLLNDKIRQAEKLLKEKREEWERGNHLERWQLDWLIKRETEIQELRKRLINLKSEELQAQIQVPSSSWNN